MRTGDEVDLTKLPFHPQHEFDGSCYISAEIDYTVDPQTGRTNVGSRRLRNRKETGTNVTAPSDLKRIHTDPVFHCTTVTMRSDAMYQTLLHGSAFQLEGSDSACISAMRAEAEAMSILRSTVREPVAVYLRETSGGAKTLRVSMRQRSVGEARAAIAALFDGIMRLKHVFVFDEDSDIFDDRQVEWAFGTRFQADRDIMIFQGMGMTMDPSLDGRRTGAKAGFDCTRPPGHEGQIPWTRRFPPQMEPRSARNH